MKYLLIILSLLSSVPSLADSLTLGLNTHHFDREIETYDCYRESHGLIAYTHNSGYGIGTYDNTYCKRSYFISKTINLIGNIDLNIPLVTGYGHLKYSKFGLTILPNFSYDHKIAPLVSIKFITVPFLLTGVSLKIDINLK